MSAKDDGRVLRPDIGPAQDITDLGKHGTADKDREAAGLNKFYEQSRGQSFRPRCRLEENHAVEDDHWATGHGHGLTFR
jgi:hypothetical protein